MQKRQHIGIPVSQFSGAHELVNTGQSPCPSPSNPAILFWSNLFCKANQQTARGAIQAANWMNYDNTRDYLLSRLRAFEEFPFGGDVAVFKIRGRMFATLTKHHGQSSMSLKCDREEAQFLRDMFDAVRPGYHMNKMHWNTVILDGSIPPGEIERMIDRSYGLVVRKLKKPERMALEVRHGTKTLYR